MINLAISPSPNHQSQRYSEIERPWEAPPSNSADTPHTSPFWLLLPISVFFLLLPAVLTLADIRENWKQWRHRRQVGAVIPCRNCYFFNTNIRLNCAVHPCQVLTENAVDCPDFKPKITEGSDRKNSIRLK